MDRGQMIFFGAAALFVFYEAFRGWRLGVVRQMVRLIALLGGYLAAIFLGGYVAVPLRLTGYPDLVLGPVAMLLAGALTYGLISFAGRVLFRKTTDQDFGLVWLVYGVSGALLGVVFGLVFVTAMALGLRFVGTLASGIAQEPEGVRQVSGSTRKAAVAGLAELRHSLDSGAAGEVLDTLDPIPPKAYALIEKIGRLSASPQALARFLDTPAARELAQNPEIAALRDDPEITLALREGRYLALLRNPRIAKVANNPKVKEIASRFDLEKALDAALQHEEPNRPNRSDRPQRTDAPRGGRGS